MNEKAFFDNLCSYYQNHNHITEESFKKYPVKRGLRNEDSTGVLVGLTNISNVHGYVIDENEKIPIDGELIYRGISITDLVKNAEMSKRFCFEETMYLLLVGELPNQQELDALHDFIGQSYELPDNFTRDVIETFPSPNVMNKLSQAVLALYSLDSDPEDLSLEHLLKQSIELIAKFPLLIVYSYQSMRRIYKKSFFFHYPKPHLSIAENFLHMLRPDKKFTPEEAKLLDVCLMVHSEHSGGNNSTFVSRVLSSSGTDTYSAIAGAIGSLKGNRHGGANAKVTTMLEEIKVNVQDWSSDSEVRAYLEKIISKKAGDGSGLIYGMGHAVYTLSDPRAVILKQYARSLAEEKGMAAELDLIERIEAQAPIAFSNVKKSDKIICANVDLYSGFVYRLLGIPADLHTPLFAMARIVGWCAHRIEEVQTGRRIIRPAYKSLTRGQEYLPIEDRR